MTFHFMNLNSCSESPRAVLVHSSSVLKSYFQRETIDSEHLLFHYHMKLGVKIHSNIYVFCVIDNGCTFSLGVSARPFIIVCNLQVFSPIPYWLCAQAIKTKATCSSGHVRLSNGQVTDRK